MKRCSSQPPDKTPAGRVDLQTVQPPASARSRFGRHVITTTISKALAMAAIQAPVLAMNRFICSESERRFEVTGVRRVAQ